MLTNHQPNDRCGLIHLGHRGSDGNATSLASDGAGASAPAARRREVSPRVAWRERWRNLGEHRGGSDGGSNFQMGHLQLGMVCRCSMWGPIVMFVGL